jgi:hypothetical protein
MIEFNNEKELVKSLKKTFEEIDYPFLKKIYVHTNLATMRFHEIWSEWWESEPPPRLEVDMILVFEDLQNSKEIFIVGIETKYFTGKKRNFYEGIQQILSFGLFGFDSLLLWHIFSENVTNKIIEGCTHSVQEIIEGYNLPVSYFGTKLVDGLHFEFFSPQEEYSSIKREAGYLLHSMHKICNRKRNPLLNREEIEKKNVENYFENSCVGDINDR